MKVLFFLLLIFSVADLICFQRSTVIPTIVYQLNDEKKLRVFSFSLKDFHDSPLMSKLKKSDSFSKIKKRWLDELIDGTCLKGVIEDRGYVKFFYLQLSKQDSLVGVLMVSDTCRRTRLNNKD